jgi:hypothetical protein
MTSRCDVVETERGKLFRNTENGNTIFFNKIPCCDELKDGILSVERSGQEIASATIGPDHSGMIMYVGLDNVLEGYDPVALRVRFFDIGDIVRIAPIAPFGFQKFIKEEYLKYLDFQNALGPAVNGSEEAAKAHEQKVMENFKFLGTHETPEIMIF